MMPLALDTPHAPTPGSTTPHINTVDALVHQFIKQLLHGCGNDDCRSSMCDTGRRNINHNRTLRTWTPRAARAIAIAIASGPNASSHVCQASYKSQPERTSWPEGPRDPSSFMQLLSDTATFRLFCTSGPFPYRRWYSDLDCAHQILDPIAEMCQTEPSSSSIISNQQAVARVMLGFKYLVSRLPQHPVAYHRHALFHIIEGRAAPTCVEHIPIDKRFEVWMKILDGHAHEPSLRLLSRITQLVSTRKSMDDAVWKARHELEQESPRSARQKQRHFINLLAIQISACDKDFQVHLYVWLHQILFRHWDGSVWAQPGTSTCGALEMLARFNVAQSVPTISSHLDAVEVARSWMKSWESPSTTKHILHFRTLFSPRERVTYLRMMNHLRMQSMISASEKTARLMRRVTLKPFEYQNQSPLEYATEHYLLLSVSRENLIRDTYDQLWQRRKSELLRPLRVRLGEIDELEIGQDLGGVQIEFFNLVCRYAFAEENQLFTTDSESGTAYFRAMSLQPLYMFELLGTLFGLALHNGITLPVTLPLYFYSAILDDRTVPNPHLPESTGPALADIQEVWPTLYRSLAAMLKQPEEPLYVDYIFPVEANGLRLTAILWDLRESPTLQIHDVTADNHHIHRTNGVNSHDTDESKIDEHAENVPETKSDESEIDENAEDVPKSNSTDASYIVDDSSNPLFQNGDEFKDWPGWTLRRSTIEPLTVTNENKHLYVQDYARWLLDCSVAPQSRAFSKGFYAVMPAHLIQFLTSRQLKSILEGTNRLSIPELQKAARYLGYDPKSKYIQAFWQIVNDWPEERQRGLLKFVTAAERIPIRGAAFLTFIIERTEFGDDEQLPTSSTCFGTLRLPRYGSPDILERKLRMAIEYGGEGFGSA